MLYGKWRIIVSGEKGHQSQDKEGLVVTPHHNILIHQVLIPAFQSLRYSLRRLGACSNEATSPSVKHGQEGDALQFRPGKRTLGLAGFWIVTVSVDWRLYYDIYNQASKQASKETKT